MSDYIPAFGAVRDAVATELAAQGAQITASAQAAAASFVAIATPKVMTSAYNAASGEVIEADTSAGSWMLVLPAGGGIVIVRDHAGTWGTNPLTIGGNGATIDGVGAWPADASGFELTFTRVGAAWRYTLKNMFGG